MGYRPDKRDFYIGDYMIRPGEQFGYTISPPDGGTVWRETIPEVRDLCGWAEIRFKAESHEAA
jgi:hypothetical protein